MTDEDWLANVWYYYWRSDCLEFRSKYPSSCL